MKDVGMKEAIQMVFRTTGYNEEDAERALRYSAAHAPNKSLGSSNFFNVCLWIDTNREKMPKLNSPSELSAAIAKDLQLKEPSVITCLKSHPFKIPSELQHERIKKTPKKSKKGHEEDPFRTKFIQGKDVVVTMVKLKPLAEIHDLEADMRAFELMLGGDSGRLSLWTKIKLNINKLFKEEKEQIKKALEAVPSMVKIEEHQKEHHGHEKKSA